MIAPLACPVFRKDFRILLKPLGWFVVLQGVYAAGALVFFGAGERFRTMSEVLVVTGWMFGQLYAFVAAAHFLAEERSDGTLVFLKRLAATRTRLYGEKVAAGFAALALLWALQAIFLALVGPTGALMPDVVRGDEFGAAITMTSTMGILVGSGASAYLVGLPISMIARQSVVVVLGGFAVWWLGFGLVLSGASMLGTLEMAWLIPLLVAPLVGIPMVLASPGRRFALLRRSASFAPAGRPWGLVWKGVVESAPLLALSVVFVGATLLASTETFVTMVGAGILISALGAAAYTPGEKHGLHSVLYHHPVPRGHLFWAKVAVASLPVLAITAAVALDGYVSGALAGPGRAAHLTPMLLLIVAFGVFAYGCSMLVALAIHRQSTAVLAAQCLVAGVAALPVALAVLLQPRSGLTFDAWMDASLRAASPATVVLAAGCLAAAWWMATNREALAAPAAVRVKWTGGLFAVALVVAAVVGAASWGRV
jgi:ABC-type transport system involved in multi-copper enzyme maturation permease subunit